jgi:AbrB family looped-hinge helix DNA binding protein
MSELLGVLTVDGKGRTVLPLRVRHELGLDEGSQMRVERTDDGEILLIPAVLVPRDQLYFHTPEMRARLSRAETSFENGTSTRTNGETETQAFLDSLKSH